MQVVRSLALLLHFYQPPTQSNSVTEQVLRSCYLPLADLLLDHPEAQFTLNISGSLLEDINAISDHAFVEKIKILLGRKQIELANGPVYHPLLPLISAPEIATHLEINRKTLAANFQSEPSEVIFPPEMAVKAETLATLSSLPQTGSKPIVLLDESSINPAFDLAKIPKDQVFSLDNLILVASSRAVTEIIRSYAKELTAEKFLKFFEENTGADQTVIAASDAEVFGHHYSERINFLRELIESKKIKLLKITDAVRSLNALPLKLDAITASTWQTSAADLKNQNPYPLWLNPDNHLQNRYNELAELAHQSWQKSESPNPAADNFYFRGISSCHYYWLSNWPWWHPDLVENGARELIKCIRSLQIDRDLKSKAEKLYHELLSQIWSYHWSGEVEKKYKEYDTYRAGLLSHLPIK